MNRSTLQKLLLARRLYNIASENIRASNSISQSVGVNLLQDSVEAFLLAVSEHVNADVDSGTRFDRYFDLINAKIGPRELPFRARLIALNKLRVNSKHYGLTPARSELDGMQVTVREFFEESSASILAQAFSTISLIDLIREGEAKELLREAEQSFTAGDFQNCLVACRKAIFTRFDSRFDIAPYAQHGRFDRNRGFGLFGMFNSSPFFARNREYIEENVKQPTDFIVFDHNELEMTLLKSGQDRVAFWNVWRLTPEVYRRSQGEEWIVKWEFNKLDEDGIRDRSEYALDTTIDLLVAEDQKYAETKSPNYRKYYVDLRGENVPVYKKADVQSEIVSRTPTGLRRIFVDYRVRGLSGDKSYWHARQYEEETIIEGFIVEDDVSG